MSLHLPLLLHLLKLLPLPQHLRLHLLQLLSLPQHLRLHLLQLRPQPLLVLVLVLVRLRISGTASLWGRSSASRSKGTRWTTGHEQT